MEKLTKDITNFVFKQGYNKKSKLIILNTIIILYIYKYSSISKHLTVKQKCL